MTIRPYDAWTLAKLLVGHALNGELADVSAPWRPLADHLAALPLDDRQAAMDAALTTRPDRADIIDAIARADIDGPPPEADGDDETDGDGQRGPATPQPQPWPPLRLKQPPPAPPFPLSVFPEPLQDYCREAAAALLAPVDFVGASMLTVAGTAIGHSVNVTVKRGSNEAPLLYLILVARAGTTKTPCIRAVVRPLADIDRRLRKESQEAHERWEEAKKAHAKDPDNTPAPGPEPPQLRAVVKDITRESLVILLKDNPRGVLCDPDEASAWVARFDEYKAKGADRQFWLSLWSSAPVAVDRKGGRESCYVPFPYVSVLGGLPPSMIGSLAEEHGREDGFLDRILFTFPDQDAFPPQHWTKAVVSDEREREWAETIGRLFAVSMVLDSQLETERPWFVHFTDAAKQAWATWFNAHGDEMDTSAVADRHAGASSKLRAHAARFALILARLRWTTDPWASGGAGKPGPIEREDVRGEIQLVTYFKGHLLKTAMVAAGGLTDRNARTILDWIVRHGRETFRAADVAKDIRRFRSDPTALTAALETLRDAGAIRPRPQTHGHGAVRPTPTMFTPISLRAPGNAENTENGSAAGSSGAFSVFSAFPGVLARG